MAGEGSSFWTTIPGILTALAGVIAAVGSLVATFSKAGFLGRRGRVGENDASGTPTDGPGPSGRTATARETGRPASPEVRTLRSAPAVLSSAKVEAMLVRLDFFEKRRNPAGEGVAHLYSARAIGDAVVVDDGVTGLTWQKVASPEPMTLQKAATYVDGLNARRFAGFIDWRLPTAEEAMSLMEPEPSDDFHIAPAFSRGGNFIWTADRPPEGGGWVIYFYDGVLAAESEAFNAWVRAVRC
jgi:hypothetical protein